MGMPNIPDITGRVEITFEETINLILASIGLEELGLAHILNAEGEKIQCIVGEDCDGDLDDLLAINRSVNDTLKNIIKAQILLQFKLEQVADLIGENNKPPHGGCKKRSKKCDD